MFIDAPNDAAYLLIPFAIDATKMPRKFGSSVLYD